MIKLQRKVAVSGGLAWRDLLASIAVFIGLSAMGALVTFETARIYTGPLRNQAKRFADSAVDAASSGVAGRLESLSQIQILTREGRLDNPADFDIAAKMALASGPGILSIHVIDPTHRIARTITKALDPAMLNEIVVQSLREIWVPEVLHDTAAPRSSELIELADGDLGIVVFYPILRGGRFEGYVGGVLRIDVPDAVNNELFAQLILLPTGSDLPESPPRLGAHRYHFAILDRTLVLDLALDRPRGRETDIAIDLAAGISLAFICAALFLLSLGARRAKILQSEMFSAILTSAPDAIVTVDENQRVVLFTPAAERMFGRSASSMIGASLDILLPLAARDAHSGYIDAFSKGGESARTMGDWRVVRGQRANGEVFPAMTHIARQRFGGNWLMTAILRDMSDVERMLSELRELASERERQVERAEAASKAKTMLLATMSHELRTPLNAIIGFSDVAALELHGPLGSPLYRDYMRDIKRSGEDLLAIFNNVLEFSKADVGAYCFDRNTFDLAEALDFSIRQVEFLAMAKEISIRRDFTDSLPCCGDEQATRRIATNLLSNAIKFTARGGRIMVAAGPFDDPEYVEFSVTDSGIGMSIEELKRIGKPFVRIGDAYRSDVQGTGLGLVIAKSFAEGMGGRLSISSTPGKGSIVRVQIPAAGGQSALV